MLLLDSMRTLIDVFTSPLHLFWLLVMVGGIGYWFKKYKLAGIAGGSALVLLVVTASDPLPNLLVESLENQYPPLLKLPEANAQRPIHILVLGGGNIPDPHLPAVDQLSYHALERLAEGIRIHLQMPGSRIITSGYGRKGQKTQARVCAEAAISLGVAPEQISLMEKPVNTYQEAAIYKQTFGDDALLILVTNAFHMPRSMRLFRSQGLHPVAAPAGHLCKEVPGGSNANWLTSEQNFTKIEIALHEYIGMLGEKWIRSE